jgi:hypothetical protein
MMASLSHPSWFETIHLAVHFAYAGPNNLSDNLSFAAAFAKSNFIQALFSRRLEKFAYLGSIVEQMETEREDSEASGLYKDPTFIRLHCI